MKEYPKLVAIGIILPNPSRQPGTHRVYLIEDEHCFIGYARGIPDKNDDYPPLLKISSWDAGALRWCQEAFPPKGDEDVETLYEEVMGIMKKDDELDYFESKHYLLCYNGIIDDKEQKESGVHHANPKNLITDSEKEAFKYY